MNDDPSIDSYFGEIVYRWLSGLFGAFLVGVGLYAMFFGVMSFPMAAR